MRLTLTHSLRSAALALLVVSCTSDRALGPERPVPPSRADGVVGATLVINEVMENPSSPEPAGEWFEVYNAGSAAVNMRGWKIASRAGSSTESYTLPATDFVVPAGAYAVFARDTSVANLGNAPALKAPYGTVALNNSGGDWLELIDPLGTVVDHVDWGTGPFTEGVSFALRDASLDNVLMSGTGSNWTSGIAAYNATGDKGSPGAENPVPGPVVTVVTRISYIVSGSPFNVSATGYDSNGLPSPTTFTWTSANPEVATITTAGRATYVSSGVAMVTATAANGVSGTGPIFTVLPGEVSSVSIETNDPPHMPVGFTKPEFATVKTTTNVTVTPTLEWSSSDPSIATVDRLGYVTGVAPGTVTIKARVADGYVYGLQQFTIQPATAPTSAVYRNHVEFGQPTAGGSHDDIVLAKPQYVLSYSEQRGGPNWVSWNLNASQFAGAPRCDCFSADQQLPAGVYRVVDFDYRNGGYDRGHMVQSESRTTTDQENATTFLLTNILPQGAENNQGPWSKFENYLNDLARTSGKEIYVVAGGKYGANPGTLKNEGKVQIPDYTWKVAVIMDGGKGLADVRSTADLQVIAVQMPNLTTTGSPASSVGMRNNPWEQYQVTVDSIEKETGYDLLDRLPKQIEVLVESTDKAPVAAVAGPYIGVEGSAIGFDATGSTDPDGDALAYAWDFGDGATGTGAQATHAYADNGTYTVTVTVSDPTGAEATATTTATVTNAKPAIAPFSLGLTPFAVYSAATLTVSFTDAGSADTHTAMIAWGDDTTQPVTVTGTGSGSFTATHGYTQAGVYTVTVTVTDDDGAFATLPSTNYVVVYDPSAGFVTGGGWIASPVGAYAYDPTLAGKATFGFVARYQKGATAPSGNTEFELREGSFSFASTSYQWLVVAGTSRAQYKGTGTIAGRSGSYDFLLTAVDDAAGDRLRVKIWEHDTDHVVYDNQAGATDPDATTALGGGSIVVHMQ